MRAFADLLDRLVYTRSRNAKLKLIADYLRAAPDPDRGWALAALTGELDIPGVKRAAVQAIVDERVDPVLYRMSRDYVGDTAETVALIWPEPLGGANSVRPKLVEGLSSSSTAKKKKAGLRQAQPERSGQDMPLGEVVERLLTLGRSEAPRALAGMLDRLDANGRYALLKLAMGGLRVGVSARLAKTALALAFDLDVDAVEEVWHGINPPYAELFAWGEGHGKQPTTEDIPVFRPFMLAHPLDEREVDMADYAVEWKWDGIRVQIVHVAGETRLYSRTGDDITPGFPDVAAAFTEPGAVDGELLVRGEDQGGAAGGAASFNALQQRLGRKTVSAKMREQYPAFVRLYDILFDDKQDLRPLPWTERRKRLETFVARLPEDRFDLSALVAAEDFGLLAEMRDGAREAAIEGVMLKRRDSAYVAGRKTGLWYKWKRDPLTADCVLMYARRGSGKRSSYYSDYTFGCWTGEGELYPVGKAYSGFTDEELKWIDRFVRSNTVGRFGPVREVEKTLVFEVAFDSVHESKRHKSGLAMRFPRISRIRRDK
ncbi:MAG: cisplatin damage response ATP-dependent DNA ligase, partial [Sphingomonadales bacterium]|nr:cisplatin damage response ATP-dependent DNA ligase [Sphingomonadales bacterium]